MKYFLGGLLLLASPLLMADSKEKILLDQNAKYQDAYVVMQADIINPDQFFNQYAFFAEKVVAAYGGVAKIAALNSATIFEGNWSNNWTLTLNFPSADAARNWYNSPEYQSLIPIRKSATAYGNMVLIESAPKSTINWSISAYEHKEPAIVLPNTLDPNPEYIVGAKLKGVFIDDSYSLQASFSEVDSTYARVSGEIRVSSLQNKGTSDVTIKAIDTAGHKLVLGKLKVNHSDQWKYYNFRINRKNNSKFNVRKLNRIAFIYSSHLPDDGTSTELKNLRIFE